MFGPHTIELKQRHFLGHDVGIWIDYTSGQIVIRTLRQGHPYKWGRWELTLVTTDRWLQSFDPEWWKDEVENTVVRACQALRTIIKTSEPPHPIQVLKL